MRGGGEGRVARGGGGGESGKGGWWRVVVERVVEGRMVRGGW